MARTAKAAAEPKRNSVAPDSSVPETPKETGENIGMETGDSVESAQPETAEAEDNTPESGIDEVAMESPAVVDAGASEVDLMKELARIPGLEKRVNKLEGVVELILRRVNVNDRPVLPPERKNYNPDRLPVGVQGTVGYRDLPGNKNKE